MAVGVPENDVFAAADAVLARGERPTVERVRQELGRGSPARVGALLDQWWEQLAARLRGETRLPGLPAEVAQAFMAIWQQATTLAQGVAEQALAGQRQGSCPTGGCPGATANNRGRYRTAGRRNPLGRPRTIACSASGADRRPACAA